MKKIESLFFKIGGGLVLLSPQLGWAADNTLNPANTAWILTATALVLFMTLPGLSLFYGGCVVGVDAMWCHYRASFHIVASGLIFTGF